MNLLIVTLNTMMYFGIQQQQQQQKEYVMNRIRGLKHHHFLSINLYMFYSKLADLWQLYHFEFSLVANHIFFSHVAQNEVSY